MWGYVELKNGSLSGLQEIEAVYAKTEQKETQRLLHYEIQASKAKVHYTGDYHHGFPVFSSTKKKSPKESPQKPVFDPAFASDAAINEEKRREEASLREKQVEQNKKDNDQNKFLNFDTSVAGASTSQQPSYSLYDYSKEPKVDKSRQEKVRDILRSRKIDCKTIKITNNEFDNPEYSLEFLIYIHERRLKGMGESRVKEEEQTNIMDLRKDFEANKQDAIEYIEDEIYTSNAQGVYLQCLEELKSAVKEERAANISLEGLNDDEKYEIEESMKTYTYQLELIDSEEFQKRQERERQERERQERERQEKELEKNSTLNDLQKQGGRREMDPWERVYRAYREKMKHNVAGEIENPTSSQAFDEQSKEAEGGRTSPS